MATERDDEFNRIDEALRVVETYCGELEAKAALLETEVDKLQSESKMLVAMLEVDQSAFVAITEQLDEHPEGYERACLCATCRSYA